MHYDKKRPPAVGNRTYIVETYHPPAGATQQGLVQLKVHDGGPGFDRDELHPTMTTLWEVRNVRTQREAVAVILEVAAGKHVPNVRNLVGFATPQTLGVVE